MKLILNLFFFLSIATLFAQTTNDQLTDSLFHAFSTVEARHKSVPTQMANLKNLATKLTTRYNPKKPGKSLKKVYTAVHDEYFVRYVDNPLFGDIFVDGTYNCVTASALYAFLFEEMNVPYEIRETPTHVYLVAYPGTHDYTVESTLPTEGILNLKEKEVENLKEELVANKVITSKEAATEGFARKYILKDTTITLANLYGIQLYNYSLTLSENGKYRQAAKTLDVALRYHQTLYLRQALMLNLAIMLRDPLITVEDRCFVVTKSYRLFEELGLDPLQESLATLDGMLPKDIPEENIATDLQELSDCIEATAIDSVLAKKLRRSANMVSASHHYNAKETDEALVYLIRNATLGNQQASLLITEVIGHHLNRITNMRDGLDSLAKYEAIFPFIKEDYDLQGFGVYFHLRMIYEHVELQELPDALRELGVFESRFKPGDDIRFAPEYVGLAYGAISSHFVRSGDEEKAKAYLKRGMKYAKDSLELRRKLKLLESDSW